MPSSREYVSGQGLRGLASAGSGVVKISRAFFSASEVFVGPRIRSNRFSVEVWISLTMPVPTTTVPACTDGRDPVQLVLQEPQALGYPYEQHVDPLGHLVPGRKQPYGIRREARPRQVGPGRLLGQEGVADLAPGGARQAPW